MQDLTLYTKNNCPACEKVKAFLTEKPNLKIEIINVNEMANPASAMLYLSQYSQTFPTLIGKDFFVTKSDSIIEFLKLLK